MHMTAFARTLLRSVQLGSLLALVAEAASGQATLSSSLRDLRDSTRIRVISASIRGIAPTIGTLVRVHADSFEVRDSIRLRPVSFSFREIARVDTSAGKVSFKSYVITGTIIGGLAGGMLMASSMAAVANVLPHDDTSRIGLQGFLGGAAVGALVGALFAGNPRERWVSVVQR